MDSCPTFESSGNPSPCPLALSGFAGGFRRWLRAGLIESRTFPGLLFLSSVAFCACEASRLGHLLCDKELCDKEFVLCM